MAKEHTAVSPMSGRQITFRFHKRWDDSTPLSVQVGAQGDVLVPLKDAVILRDMLNDILPVVENPRAPESFTASNGYTIIDRSPYAMIIQDRAGVEKYRVGKYTVTALREYFERPLPTPPAPTLREQFDALGVGDRFRYPDGRFDSVMVKVDDDSYFHPTSRSIVSIDRVELIDRLEVVE
jgi:hypothetical protein